jgi:integrase
MREQKGYVFRKGKSWFVRFMDDKKQPDGSYKRMLVCKKLEDLPDGAKRKQAEQCAKEKFLDPVNRGLVNPKSNDLVTDFVDKVYLPEYVEKNLRAATLKQYGDVWRNHLKPRMGKLTLRDFRTVHGETMLAKIAEQSGIGRSSLRHCKAFLSGAFKQAKRLGILDGVNPVQDVSVPRAPEPEETYAYALDEIKAMLAVLSEPAWTVVLCAGLTGLRKGEIRGLTWENFDGKQLSVKQSVWNSVVNEPKTRRSSAPIPVVKQLADALEAHKARMGKLAVGPIFQAGNGKPLNLDNLARRAIIPALSRCAMCRKQEEEHKPEAHVYERDKSLPRWHGWHAFRRGLATNLHALGIDDKTIQAILRHSNVGLTMNVYVKSVSESQVSAMDTLSEKLGTCTELATKRIQ